MMEPQISPLARRLAEENSIDWRVIQGTGPDNRVIERDILTYLARIMSGEIDPPALPDASEPPPSSTTAPDLAAVSNLEAASAGMAKEGIDLGSLLGQAPTPSSAPLLTTPSFEPTGPTSAPLANSASFIEGTPAFSARAPEPEFTLEDLRLSDPEPSAPAFDFAVPNTVPPVATPAAPLAFDAPSASLESLTFDDLDAAAATTPPISTPPMPAITPATSAEVEFDFDLDDLEEPQAVTAAAPVLSDEEDLVLTVDTGVEQAVTLLPEPEVTRPSDDFAFSDVSGEPVLEIEEAQPAFTAEHPVVAEFSVGSAQPVVEALDSEATFAPSEPATPEPAAVEFAPLEVAPSEPALPEFALPEFKLPEPALPESTLPEPAFTEPVHAAPMDQVDMELDDAFEMDLVDEEPTPPATFTEPTAFETPDFEAVAPANVEPAAPSFAEQTGFGTASSFVEQPSLTPPSSLTESVDVPQPFSLPAQPDFTAQPSLTAQQPEQTPAEAVTDPTPEPAPSFEPVVAPAVGVAAAAAAFAVGHTHDDLPASAPVSNAPVSSAATSNAAVSSGFYQGFAVRRHFDAGPLVKIQGELSGALNNREVPLAVFLGRAAQRNLHTLGTTDTVTLARLGDTLEPLNTPSLHHSFLEAVQSVARATPAGTAYGLIVLDSSHLAVDDLVLPGAQPVLTLNVNGEYGHLSLAGDLPAARAAEFLGRVAAALEVPVGLVI